MSASRPQPACWSRRGSSERSRDLERIAARRVLSPPPADPPSGVRSIPWLESRLASGDALLPLGMPADWLGQSVDVYGVPTVPGSSVSFAIRWHGERPAVLWEQTGAPVELTAPIAAPGWRDAEPKGEALWPPPPGATTTPIDIDADPGSFS